MAIIRNSSFHRFTLAPGQQLPQEIGGTYCRYVEGTAPLFIRLDDQPEGEFQVGTGTFTGFFSGQEQAFSKVTMRNANAFEMTVVLWVGFSDWLDSRRNQIEAATEWVPAADVVGVYEAGILAAGETLELTGAVAPGRVRRKCVQISNLDPAVNLKLVNAAGLVGGIVRPGETIAPPVSEYLGVLNDSGAAVACTVSEIWWKP